MREHGIDVYDDLIDHSYDEEPDAIKRYDKVVACIDQAVGWRNYGQMMSLIAKRQIRNQILLTHDQHWIMEIDNSVGKFFEQNKISI
jgi:phosphodiesterase/alkaline phosphatase D-like protein